MTIKSSQLLFIFLVIIFSVVNLYLFWETPNWVQLKDQYENAKAKGLGNQPWRYNDIIVEIGRLGDPEAIPFLREVATQPMPTRTPVSTKYKDIARYESDHGKAEVALVLLGDDAIFQKIVEHTRNEDVFVRHSALKKLNAIGGERVIEPLANYIGDKSIVLEIESMRILREVKLSLYGEVPNWVQLKDQYEIAKAKYLSIHPWRYKNEPWRYNDIIVEIGRLGDPEAIPFLREVATQPMPPRTPASAKYMDIARYESDHGKAEVALVLLGDDDIFQKIVEHTRYDDVFVRRSALNKLNAIGGERVIEPLANYIGDNSVVLEIESMRILREVKLSLYGEIPNWVELKDQYENAKAKDTANMPRRYNDIIVEIGRLGDPEAIPFLREVANRPMINYLTHVREYKDIVRYDSDQGRAEVALVLLGDDAIFQRIVEHTRHEDRLVRYTALMKLKAIGGDRVIEPLANYIGDHTLAEFKFLDEESMKILSKLVPNPPWSYPSDRMVKTAEYKEGVEKWYQWKEKLFKTKQGINTDSVSDPDVATELKDGEAQSEPVEGEDLRVKAGTSEFPVIFEDGDYENLDKAKLIWTVSNLFESGEFAHDYKVEKRGWEGARSDKFQIDDREVETKFFLMQSGRRAHPSIKATRGTYTSIIEEDGVNHLVLSREFIEAFIEASSRYGEVTDELNNFIDRLNRIKPVEIDNLTEAEIDSMLMIHPRLADEYAGVEKKRDSLREIILNLHFQSTNVFWIEEVMLNRRWYGNDAKLVISGAALFYLRKDKKQDKYPSWGPDDKVIPELPPPSNFHPRLQTDSDAEPFIWVPIMPFHFFYENMQWKCFLDRHIIQETGMMQLAE